MSAIRPAQGLSTMDVTSNPANGAITTTSMPDNVLGVKSYDSFYIDRQEGFSFPDMESLMISVPEATIWYNTPNIFSQDYTSSGILKNNVLQITYWENRDLTTAEYNGLDQYGRPLYQDRQNGSLVPYQRALVLELSEGLYSVDLINQRLTEFLVAQDVPCTTGENSIDATSSQIVSFLINDENGTISIYLQHQPVPSTSFPLPIETNMVSLTLGPQSPYEMLGFAQGTYAFTTTAGLLPNDQYVYNASKTAAVNRTQYYYINSNIVDAGLPINGQGGYVIGRVQIKQGTQIGSQISYEGINKRYVNADALLNGQGKARKQVRFWLTNQNGKPVHTMGEFWTCRIDFDGIYKSHNVPHAGLETKKESSQTLIEPVQPRYDMNSLEAQRKMSSNRSTTPTIQSGLGKRSAPFLAGPQKYPRF